MTLKVSMLLTADASQMKSEFGSAATVVTSLGSSAESSAADVAKLDGALDGAAAASKAAGTALATVASTEKNVATAASGAAAAIVTAKTATDGLSQSSRAAGAGLAAIGAGGATAATGLAQTAQGISAFEALAASMVQSSAEMQKALQRTTEAQENLFERMQRPKSSEDPFKPQADGADALRAKYNPLFAIGHQYKQQVDEIRAAHADGKIGFQEMGVMIDDAGAAATRSQMALVKMDAALGRTGQAARLTSNQLLNLSRQGNDTLTMWFMGAPLSQIVASQMGQIYGALEEGPRGLRGSMQAIGGYIGDAVKAIGPLNLALIGIGIAGAGAAYLIGRSFPSATEVAEKHASVIERASAKYGDLSAAIKRMREESTNAIRIDVTMQTEDAERLFRAQMRGLADYAIPSGLTNWDSVLQPISAQLRAFQAEIEAGGGSAVDLREKLRGLYDQAGTTGDMRSAIRAFLGMSEGAAQTEQQLNELGITTKMMSQEFRNFQRSSELAGASLARFLSAAPSGKSQFQTLTEDFQRWQEASRNLIGPSQVPDLYRRAVEDLTRGPRQAADAAERRLANLSLGPNARRIAELRQAADVEIAEMERVKESAVVIAERRRQLNAEIAAEGKEITRDEEARRAGYALDLRAAEARTAAEKASIEAERVRIDLRSRGETDKGLIEARAEEASVKVLTEARAGYSESLRQQEIAGGRQLDQARLEYELIGRSVGEVARLQAEFQLLAQAKDAARAAGFEDETIELTEAMRKQAAVLGQLADATARLNLERDQTANLDMLQGELGLVRMSERERTVARAGLQAEADLRRQGIDLNDEWGRSYVQNARLAAGMQAEIDRQTEAYDRQRDLLQNVASTFLDIFDTSSADSFFDRVLGGLADIGRQLAEVGKNKLIENLFGGALGYTGGTPAVGQRSVFPTGMPQGGTFAGGAGVRLYAPSSATGATASQAVTEQLSTNVTKTVSDNLLRSMLYSGRDPSHITGLNRDFASSLTDMFEAAPQAVRSAITINSGFRSVARQAELFEGALKKYGSEAAARRMVAPPGRSQHNFGRAVDLGYGNSAAREWVHSNAGRFGMRFPMSWENWHLEPANARGGGGGNGGAAALRTAVRDGSLDATRAIASGQSGMPSRVPMPSARPGQAAGASGQAGSGLTGALGGFRDFLQTPTGMGAMNAITAFSGGMQSGSPIGGAFSGALGAFGMGLGPVGIGIGLVGGLIGGIFGRSKRKKEERRQRQEQERQQQLQAQQQLDQQLPAILDLQDTLLDRASGTLTKERARIESQLKQYAELAKTAKNSTEQQRIASMQANLDDYMARLYEQTRLSAGAIERSMLQGRGQDPEFARAVAAVRDQSLEIRNYIADLTAAAGTGSAEVIGATAAGRTQLLRQLSGSQEVTEIYTRLDTLSGTAAQLGSELQKLGLNAEEAAAAIRDHLGRGIQRMRDDFVRGISDETADGMGLGYLSQIRELIERRDTMRSDAVSLGADPALIDRWFGVQARNILDQAGLVGDALKPLVAAFPDLAGVLGDASAKIDRALADAESDLRTAYTRLRSFADALADARKDLRLDSSLSTLGPLDRLTEAQNRFRDVAARAAAGDADAQDELIGLSRSYLEEAKSYYASTEGYYAAFNEVSRVLTETEAKAVAELDMAKAQHNALLGLDVSVKSVAQAVDAFNQAQAARDTAQALALQAYVQALNPQAAIPSYQAPTVSVATPAPAAPAPTPAPAAPAQRNASLWNGSGWSNYVGDYQTVNGRQIFVPNGMDPGMAWVLHVRQQDAPRGGQFGPTYNEKRNGGLIGSGVNGLGYRNGGVIGNGVWDHDSVTARHKDGGEVWLAGGEGILTARAMSRPGVEDFMHAANAGSIRFRPSSTATSTNDGSMVAAIERLRMELADVTMRLAMTIETSDERTRGTIRDTAEGGRRRTESADRIARRRATLKAA